MQSEMNINEVVSCRLCGTFVFLNDGDLVGVAYWFVFDPLYLGGGEIGI